MELEKKKDISIVYWLRDIFSDVSSLKVVDEYREQELSVPSIALETGPMSSKPFQLGDRTKQTFKTWYIDLYANSSEQRNEMAYRIMRLLDEGISVYDYDEGFPPSISPTKIGLIGVLEQKYDPISVVPDLLEVMYWRGSVTIFTDYSEV